MGARMRVVGAALFGVSFWGFAAGASAQNGLQRFESDIKPQLEVKKFTYGSASALGSAGFVLNSVVAALLKKKTDGEKARTATIHKGTSGENGLHRPYKGAIDEYCPRSAHSRA